MLHKSGRSVTWGGGVRAMCEQFLSAIRNSWDWLGRDYFFLSKNAPLSQGGSGSILLGFLSEFCVLS